MYCGITDAYNTASDLLKEHSDCVYDNIINDGESILDKCNAHDMFTAQGDFRKYSDIGDINEIYGTNMRQFEHNEELGGTPISEIKCKRQKINNDYAPAVSTNQCSECDKSSVQEYTIDRSHVHTDAKVRDNKKPNVPNNTEDEHIRAIVDESFRNIIDKRISPPTKNKLSGFGIILSDLRDGIMIMVIGILMLFLLDILLRIGKKL